MLDICNDEVTVLDLHCNVSKSAIMRAAPRWNKSCAEVDLESSRLKFIEYKIS